MTTIMSFLARTMLLLFWTTVWCLGQGSLAFLSPSLPPMPPSSPVRLPKSSILTVVHHRFGTGSSSHVTPLEMARSKTTTTAASEAATSTSGHVRKTTPTTSTVTAAGSGSMGSIASKTTLSASVSDDYYRGSSNSKSISQQLLRQSNLQLQDNAQDNVIESLWTNLPVFVTIPSTLAVVSFATFPELASGFWNMLDALSQSSFASVDGGKLQSELLLPVLNGPLLGACSILFATLTAMTISNLYNRQVTIRESMSNELEELRQLALFVSSLPPKSAAQSQATRYLRQHLDQLLRYETYAALGEWNLIPDNNKGDDGIRNNNSDMLRSSFAIRQVGMDPLTQLLNQLLYRNDDKDSNDPKVPVALIVSMHDCIIRVNSYRGKLLTALQTRLPPVHYWILFSLAGFVATIFLLETAGRDLLLFLADFELRLMWTMLISVFTLIGCVIYDLGTPFTGTYATSRPNDDAVRQFVLGPLLAPGVRTKTTTSILNREYPSHSNGAALGVATTLKSSRNNRMGVNHHNMASNRTST